MHFHVVASKNFSQTFRLCTETVSGIAMSFLMSARAQQQNRTYVSQTTLQNLLVVRRIRLIFIVALASSILASTSSRGLRFRRQLFGLLLQLDKGDNCFRFLISSFERIGFASSSRLKQHAFEITSRVKPLQT